MRLNPVLVKDELRISARRLRRSLKFTSTVLLQLSVGIAGIVVVHAILDAMILRPLPFKAQDRLVMLWEENSGKGLTHQRVAPDKFRDWKGQLRSLQEAAAYQLYDTILAPATNPQRVRTARVSAGYFELFHLAPILGRTLNSSDTGGNAPLVVISENLWKNRFAGDWNVLGSIIALGDNPYTVVGVVPASAFPANADVFVPLSDTWRSRVAHSLFVVGILQPSSSIDDCRLELSLVSQRLQQSYPATDKGWSATATPLRDEILGDSRLSVELAWGGAFIVLLIACFNVANLMLARFRGRLGEVALRTAFGATRPQIVLHFLGEPVILGCSSAVLGLILAQVSLQFLVVPLWGDTLRNLPPVAMDWRVLLFSAAVLVLAVALAGILPAMRVSMFSPMSVLQAENPTATRKSRFATTLVVFEVALSACLLLCAGLVIKSLLLLGRVDPGFRTAGITTAEFTLGFNKFNTALSRAEFVEALVAGARRDAAVIDAGVTSSMPLGGRSEPFHFLIEGVATPQHADMNSAEFRAVSPEFLKVMGIPLIQGRLLDQRDGRGQPMVVLVNSAMAKRYWPAESPIGKRISIDGPAGPWRTIVGVIGDTRESSLDRASVAELYVPVSQQTPWTLTLVVRHKGPDFSEAEVRQIFAGRDSEVVPYHIKTAEALVSDSLAAPQARGVLLGLCALVGVLLAAIGMYSSLASAVSHRTREIGIKMSLGATRYDVGRSFAFEGFVLTLAGLASGTAAGLAIARAFSSQLYGIHPLDAPIILLVIASTLLVGMTASLLPAVRASRVEPVRALRDLG